MIKTSTESEIKFAVLQRVGRRAQNQRRPKTSRLASYRSPYKWLTLRPASYWQPWYKALSLKLKLLINALRFDMSHPVTLWRHTCINIITKSQLIYEFSFVLGVQWLNKLFSININNIETYTTIGRCVLNIQSLSATQSMDCYSFIKTKRPMLFRHTITVCYYNHMPHVNALFA